MNFEVSPLLTDDISIPEPYLKLSIDGEEYGFENKDILRFDKKKEQWFRFMTVDFHIEHACLFEGKLILIDRSLKNHYAVDLNQKAVHTYELPNSIFSGLHVKEVQFEHGSQGCFHSKRAAATYVKKGDKFILDEKVLSNSRHLPLPSTVNKIDTSTIEQAIKIIDKSRFEKVSLSDLNITESDIKKFKTFIDKKEAEIKKSGHGHFDYGNLYIFPGEKADFNFYRSVADSLSSLSEEDINNTFWEAHGNWSTTTDWRKVSFVFQNGKTLVIKNSDDKPNYLYTPWVVNFEGLRFTTNSILFGQQIDSITNGQFFEGVTADKNYAIFKIADYLYKKKMDEK